MEKEVVLIGTGRGRSFAASRIISAGLAIIGDYKLFNSTLQASIEPVTFQLGRYTGRLSFKYRRKGRISPKELKRKKRKRRIVKKSRRLNR